MRVLITTLHFHPLVPIARALEAAGHEVAFACHEDYRPAMDASGLRFFPAGTSMAELMPDIMPMVMRLPEDQRANWVIRNAFCRAIPERMIPDLLAICYQWQPDLIVRDSVDMAGCLVAEHLGLPHASVEVGIFMDAASLAGIAGAELNNLRAGLGLPPDPALEMLYRHLHLSFVPPSYQDPSQPLPPTAHALRTVVFDRSGDESLPAWVHDLPDRPTVYATLGMVFNRTPGVFQAIVEGLGDQEINLIVTAGREQDPAELGPLPPNVHVERYIPQSLLLPYCDLVVAHGGWNTAMAALTLGLPMVLIPIGADQPDNARSCDSLGVARVLDRNTLVPDAVRNAVGEVLENPSYRRNAERLRDEMQSLPGPVEAVLLLEGLARVRKSGCQVVSESG